jgi:hypothetical protein
MSRPIGSKNSKIINKNTKNNIVDTEIIETPEVENETTEIIEQVTKLEEAPELTERRRIRMEREEIAKKERESSGLKSFK